MSTAIANRCAPFSLWRAKVALLVICSIAAGPLHPQAVDDPAALRQQAIDLYKQGKFDDALPLFEKLNSVKPGDPGILEGLSFCTLQHAATLTDPAARKAERAKGRRLAAEAAAAGDQSNLLKLIEDVPADGSEISFSSRTDVDQMMKAGEAAFAKGDWDAAVENYQRALALDPKQYNAALFLGDVFFKKNNHEEAGRWLSRAIQIDPNQETAYRYWGDDLVAQGRYSEAKGKFIEAVVAQPYDKRSWIGLIQWAKKQNVTLAHPAIQPPGRLDFGAKDEKGQTQTNIVIDPSTLGDKAKKDGSTAWFIYPMERTIWHNERFQKEFPGEQEYRHSLPEEVDSYQLVVDQLREGLKKKGEIKHLDPALASLVKLADEGLLEAFILISKADAGIAVDYPAFRDAHREKVTRYIEEWIVHSP